VRLASVKKKYINNIRGEMLLCNGNLGDHESDWGMSSGWMVGRQVIKDSKRNECT
jgi:hypothetical protein